MKKIILLVALLFVGFQELCAQQDAQYTQYMYNTMSVNPAYAGSREVFSATALHRSQWVGLEGAPTTQTLTVHSPVGKNEKVGLGVSIVNDKIGPTQETYLDIDFSYNVPMSDSGTLYFGLKAGGHLLDVNYNKLNPYNSGDALLQNNIENKFSPNIGVGLYYRQADRWYLGLSAPNLLETKHFDNEQLSVARERINLYLIGGYVLDLSSDFKFKPAVLFKAVSGAPLQADITANFIYNEKLTLGAAYRWSAAFSGLIGYQVSEQIMLGFAYDREVTDLGNATFNNGSFEVFLRFELSRLKKALSPRFF